LDLLEAMAQLDLRELKVPLEKLALKEKQEQ